MQIVPWSVALLCQSQSRVGVRKFRFRLCDDGAERAACALQMQRSSRDQSLLLQSVDLKQSAAKGRFDVVIAQGADRTRDRDRAKIAVRLQRIGGHALNCGMVWQIDRIS